MKKHLLAVAVTTAITAPAMAQNVSVYGLFDAGFATSSIVSEGVRTSQKAIGGLDSANGTGTLSGSRLGFRGTEDLGGGLRVGFVYETGINYSRGIAATTTPADNAANIGTNAPGFNNVRQGFVEVAGGFGSIRVGTQNTLMKDTTESIDPLGGVTMTGAASVYQAGVNGRRDTITYQSPAFGALTVRAQAYVGENTRGGAANVEATNSGAAFSLDYTAGPLKLVGISERITKQTYAANGNRLVNIAPQAVNFFDEAAATTIDNLTYNAVGGSYRFGFGTVHAMATRLSINDDDDDNDGSIQSGLIGLTLPLGGPLSVRGSMSIGKIRYDDATQSNLRAFQIVGQYELSKRTHFYAGMGQTHYKDAQDGSASEVKVSQSGIGLRHSF